MTDQGQVLTLVADVIDAAERGEDVDLEAVRVVLVASIDQGEALVAHCEAWGSEAITASAEALARVRRGLLDTIDVLEAEGPEAARAAFTEARRSFGG